MFAVEAISLPRLCNFNIINFGLWVSYMQSMNRRLRCDGDRSLNKSYFDDQKFFVVGGTEIRLSFLDSVNLLCSVSSKVREERQGVLLTCVHNLRHCIYPSELYLSTGAAHSGTKHIVHVSDIGGIVSTRLHHVLPHVCD